MQDFLQILSIFASFKFSWPPQLTSVFNTLSLASFNLEFLAPECTVSVHYIDKWLVTAALPIMLALAVLIVLLAVKVLQVRCDTGPMVACVLTARDCPWA